MCLATLAGGRLNSCGRRRGAPSGFPEGGDPLGPSGARMEGGEGPMRSRDGLAGRAGSRGRPAGPFERMSAESCPPSRLQGYPASHMKKYNAVFSGWRT